MARTNSNKIDPERRARDGGTRKAARKRISRKNDRSQAEQGVPVDEGSESVPRKSSRTLVKSTCPFNYAGSKATHEWVKVIDEPVVDLFAGGGGFYSNVASREVVVNDIIQPLVDIQQMVYAWEDAEFERFVRDVYKRTAEVVTKDDYVALREQFNKDQDPFDFYCLLCTCTNNLIRFNKRGGFNQTWGKRKFNQNTEAKLRSFRERIREKDIVFLSKSFYEVDPGGKLVFADPPYIVTEAGYNTFWSADLEKRLYAYLLNCQFVLTNYLSKGDAVNSVLADFLDEYDIEYHTIKHDKKGQKEKSEVVEILAVGENITT